MIKLVNTHEVKQWFKDTVIGLTQKQLKEFVDEELPINIYCIESEEKPLNYEIFINLRDTSGEKGRRMVVVNRDKSRRLYRSETACRLVLKDLGFDSVQFFSAAKRKSEGLDKGDNEDDSS